MVKVNPTEEDLKTTGNRSWFDVGEYEVGIESATFETDKNGKDYIQWNFADVNDTDIKGDCRNYLTTEKAVLYAMRTMQGIAVHNAADDTEKERIRKTFLAVKDSDELKTMVGKYTNMTAFIQVYEDENSPNPNGGYYRRTNIFGYMPKPRKTTVEQIMGNVESLSTDEIPFD